MSDTLFVKIMLQIFISFYGLNLLNYVHVYIIQILCFTSISNDNYIMN